ncbi:hypothetical protein ACFL6C_11450 [Myxococcota bacterium]
MYRPTYTFDLVADPRMSTPKIFCDAIDPTARAVVLFVWVCCVSRQVADQLGHIYWRIVASTLADLSEEHGVALPIYQVGRGSFVSLDASRFGGLTEPELSAALRDSVAWFLLLDHGHSPRDAVDTPPQELLDEADQLLGSQAAWERHSVSVSFPEGGGPAPGDRLFAYFRSDAAASLSGWEPNWPGNLAL